MHEGRRPHSGYGGRLWPSAECHVGGIVDRQALDPDAPPGYDILPRDPPPLALTDGEWRLVAEMDRLGLSDTCQRAVLEACIEARS